LALSDPAIAARVDAARAAGEKKVLEADRRVREGGPPTSGAPAAARGGRSRSEAPAADREPREEGDDARAHRGLGGGTPGAHCSARPDSTTERDEGAPPRAAG